MLLFDHAVGIVTSLIAAASAWFGTSGAIVVVTLLAEAALLPLTISASVRVARLRALKPELDALQALYPDDPRRLAEERAALIRREGLTAGAGMILSLGFAFVVSLAAWRVSRAAHRILFLGIGDLSRAASATPAGLLVLGAYAVMSWASLRQTSFAHAGQAFALLVPLAGAAFLASVPGCAVLPWATRQAIQLTVQTAVLRRSSRA